MTLPHRSVLLPFSFLLFTTCCYLYVYHLATSSSSDTNTSTSTMASNQQQHRSADIAIIGGGLAGLAASLEASTLNPALRILLLEKEPKLGGNSAKASSGINAALDAQDAPVFAQDTLASGGGLSFEQMVRVFVAQSPNAIAFLEKSGVDLSVLCQLGGHSSKRTHRNAKGPNVGFAIVSALQKKLTSEGDDAKIQVLTGVSVDKVRYEDGRVTGLHVTKQSTSDGEATKESETIDTPVVILATGGFSANHELLKKFAPGMEQFPTTNGPWARGDGLALAQGVGAELVLMDKVQLHPTAFINPKDRDATQKFLAPEAIRGSGALMLNANGKRFVNELSTRDRVSQAILTQPGKSAFLLLFEGAKPLESSLGFYKHIGLVKLVQSVAEVAEYCQFKDPQALLQELNAYADSAEGKQPDAFGKTVFPFPLRRIEDTQAPVEIHIMEVAPAVHYTMGGVKINENAQVLRADGSAIDGLYAAGEVSGGLHGANRLGGNSLAECVVFGRIAAQQAVRQVEQAQQQQQRTNDLWFWSMSSSGDSAFRNGDESDASAASSDRSSDGSFDSAAEANDDDNDAIFISSHSQIVISPRRRIGASTWKQFEERIGREASARNGAQCIAEQLGVDALRRKKPKAKTAAARTVKAAGVRSKTLGSRATRSSSTTRGSRTTTKTTGGASGDARSAATTTKRSSSKTRDTVARNGASTNKPMLDQNLLRTKRSTAKSAPRVSAVAASSPVTDRRRNRSSGDASGGRRVGAHRQTESSGSDSRSESGGELHHQEGDEESDGESESESGRETERPLPAKASNKTSAQRPESPTSSSTEATKARLQRTKAPMSLPSAAASPLSSGSSSPVKRNQKPASYLSENSGVDGLSFSAAAVLPSPKEEMEELKQTLKKLASHDHEDIGSGGLTTKISTTAGGAPTNGTKSGGEMGSSEYLRVAMGLTVPHHPSADQLRLGEYVSQPFASNPTAPDMNSSFLNSKVTNKASGSRHASFDSAALGAKLQPTRETNSVRSSRSKSLFANTSALNGSSDFQTMSDGPRLSSLNQKLFGQTTAGSPSTSFMPGSHTNPYSSHMNGSSSNMQSMLGMNGGITGGITGMGAAGGAQGSRAVLSALKALQDKIRRLEEERETLLQQLSDEKVKARKREAELASSEKKFSYELGQTKESARAAYDTIRSEREELKVELVKTEERKRSMETEISHFQALMKTYSSKSDDLQTQLEISESQRKRQRGDFEHLQAKYKGETQDLKAKVASLEQQQQANDEQIKLLDAQFQREASNHAETRERLQDSEQSVASISQLNEKLVARVWEVTDVANKTAKQNKKLLQQQRVSTVSKTTAASRASAAAAQQARGGGGGADGGALGSLASKRAAGSAALIGRGTGGSSEGAARLRKKASSTSTGTSSRAKRAGGGVKKARNPADGGYANNMELLREANLGKDIPFLLGTSSNPSFSIIGNVQDAIRQCDTTCVTPNTLTGVGSNSSSYAPIKIPTATTTTRSSSNRASAQQRTPKATRATKTKSSSGVSAKILGMDVGTAMPTTMLSDRTAKAERKSKPSAIQVPPPPASVSAHINPMQTQIMDDLGTALQSAEKEFATLNARYKDIVSRMKAEGTNSSSTSNGGGSSAQLSSALGPLLDELEAKGKQVNLLKQVYQQAANSSINPLRRIVHSPEAIRRKTASLRLLNEYRQLERDARSSSPHQHQHQRNQSPSTSFFSDQEKHY